MTAADAAAAAVALVVAAAVAWLVARNASRIGLLDIPNARSSHAVATPRGGGIGVVAGVAAGMLVFIAAGSYTGGDRLLSTTTLNPDLVGEIRLILAPVDAELGRGNSQIQISTRSGTNKFAGSAVWNIQNTSLNPNTWNRNNNVGTSLTGCKIKGQTPPCWNPTQPDWRNVNQYTLSYGGPIIKNKTFFFALWDQQISLTRALQSNTVLTDAARNGIFRFWEGWVPGNAVAAITTSTTSANPARPAVNPSMSVVVRSGDRLCPRLTLPCKVGS